MLGWLARDEGDYRTARSRCEEALSLSREEGDPIAIARALNILGSAALGQGDWGAARSFLEESLALRREQDEQRGVAATLGHLARLALRQGEAAAARTYLEESLAIGRELGARGLIAGSISGLGQVALSDGDAGSARTLFEESLAIQRELDNRHGIACSIYGLGRVALHQGETEQAAVWFRESLSLRRGAADQQGIVECLKSLATVAATQATKENGLAERATRLFAAAQALRQELATPFTPHEHQQQDEQLAALRATLGDAAYSAAWEGRAITPEQAIAEALGVPVPPGPRTVQQMPPRDARQRREGRPRTAHGDLTVQEWERIRPLLPSSAGRRGRPYQEHRRVINGILWVLGTGAAWRDLPSRYGSWHTCHERFRRWRRQGLWDRIVAVLESPADSALGQEP
jgi:transposase/uncharacterized protein HemY